jgi:phosphatidylglycerol lysyltransferase
MSLVTMRKPGGGTTGLARHVQRHLLIQALPILAVTCLLWANRRALVQLEMHAILAGIGTVPPATWLAAAALTALSFWSVGQYDVTLHRHFGTRIPPHRARVTGMTAVALGQAFGLAPVIGTLVRWRLLPDVPPPAIVRLSAGVAMSFLAGWAVVTALAVMLLAEGVTAHWFTSAARTVLILAAAGLVITLRRTARTSSARPNALTLARIVAFVTIDTISAALVLWLLLPPGIDTTVSQIIPAYLLALGAGLVLSTPGGIGAFEVALLTLLPAPPDEAILGAVLAYRLVYVALPALAALVTVACRPSVEPMQRSPFFSPTDARETGLSARAMTGQRGEPLVIRQGEHGAIADDEGAFWVTAALPVLLVALDDPVAARSPAGLERMVRLIDREAAATARIACLYKCGGRAAAAARRAGYRVIPVAAEAGLAPSAFDCAGPEHAQLRRKLRRAARAGVQVTPSGPNLPLAAMAEIATSWSRSHGGERGFSMGRFDPAYVAGQQVFLAHAGDRLVAFATFHAAAGEWTLDLMRHCPDVPDGTMHALIAVAVDAARAYGIPRLSLAGLPLPAHTLRSPALRWLHALGARMSGHGLTRFKTSFAPSLTRRYIAAPSGMALIFAAIGIARAIRKPPPVIPLMNHNMQPTQTDQTIAPPAARTPVAAASASSRAA